MRALGYFLLNWTLLERTVLEEIKRLRMLGGESGTTTARARGPFSERLAEWRALAILKSRRSAQAAQEVAEIAGHVERLGRTRNLLAHHLSGIEKTVGGEWVLLASESGVASARGNQTAFKLEELAQLSQQILSACERITNLKIT